MPSQHRQVQLQVVDQHAQRSGDALLHGTSLGGAGGADGASWIWIKQFIPKWDSYHQDPPSTCGLWPFLVNQRNHPLVWTIPGWMLSTNLVWNHAKRWPERSRADAVEVSGTEQTFLCPPLFGRLCMQYLHRHPQTIYSCSPRNGARNLTGSPMLNS